MNAKTKTQTDVLHGWSTSNASANQTTDAVVAPAIAIFSLPKSFDDPNIACIQRNAIASWVSLGENVEVVLIGDEAGIADTANEFGVVHVGDVRCNEHGTPLVNDAFEIARNATQADVLVYCNADVILLHDFKAALTEIMRGDFSNEFLAIGRRTNLSLQESVDFGKRESIQELLKKTDTEGDLGAIVCKEYFAFRRGQFQTLPPFAVGRGNWDNWMVANSKRRRVPVIDLSAQVTAIHQNHDYQHVGSELQDRLRRKHCYLSGPEARMNQKLAQGKHVISGSTASHRLTHYGVVKNRLSWLNLNFWTDLPRFASLVRQLFLG